MAAGLDIDPDDWCTLSLVERREHFARAVAAELGDVPGIVSVTIELGPVGREYDLTIAVQTDAGRLRTPLWSHARATIYCDPSIHSANRRQLGPDRAAAESVARLRPRLAVPYRMESRGMTFTQALEEGVERVWTVEHARFRKRTAVTREDVVANAGELDVRDLLAHFYSGPSLRLVGDGGEAILLPEANEPEGELVTLCHACSRWTDGSHPACPSCGSPAVDPVVAARPARR